MSNKKAALLEIHGTHEECVYSQLLFLKNGGFDTTFIYEASLKDKIKNMNVGNAEIAFDIRNKKGWAYWKTLWAIRNYIIQNNLETVIFNTAHGNLIRDFSLLPFPKKFSFFGTLHGLNKLKGSVTQNIITRKIKHYFLLNDYLKQNVTNLPHDSRLKFESFYPIYFPNFENQPNIEKPQNQCWIGIPGQVEYKRRDYETLIKAFATLEQKPNIKFIFLGNEKHASGNGKELKALIQQHHVEAYCQFTGYLDYPEYHAFLKQCDIIAPLIHPGNDGYEKYLIYQITGGYNLAFAYQKPLMMLNEFERYEDFKENAIFYSLDNLAAVLQTLQLAILDIQPRLYQQKKWQLKVQTTRYISFLK